MILTMREYAARDQEGHAFDADMAQTVASWWYSPGTPAMITFVTRGQITAGLADEINRELGWVLSLPPESGLYVNHHRRDLRGLLSWVRGQGVDPDDFMLTEREPGDFTLDEG